MVLTDTHKYTYVGSNAWALPQTTYIRVPSAGGSLGICSF